MRLASDRAGLLHAADDLKLDDGIVVQDLVPSPLVMVQAVFDHGNLLAWHVNLREREGSSGGASAKRSIALPVVSNHLESLGGALAWHGALSLDAILTPDGPLYIDVNPRLVEPANAWRAGVDLVSALLDVSTGKRVNPLSPGRVGVRTHQLLLAVLGAAQHGEGRRGIARELAAGLTHRGPYAGSVEELTPLDGDPLAAIPVAAAALATLGYPASWQLFTDGAVSAYALTPTAWKQIVSNPAAPRRTAADSRRRQSTGLLPRCRLRSPSTTPSIDDAEQAALAIASGDWTQDDMAGWARASPARARSGVASGTWANVDEVIPALLMNVSPTRSIVIP